MLSEEELIAALAPWTPTSADPALIGQIIPLVQTRINRLSEFQRQAGFFFGEPDYRVSMLTPHKAEFDGGYHLLQLADPLLSSLDQRGALAPEVLDALLTPTGTDKAAEPYLTRVLGALEIEPTPDAIALLRQGQLVLQTIELREKAASRPNPTPSRLSPLYCSRTRPTAPTWR